MAVIRVELQRSQVIELSRSGAVKHQYRHWDVYRFFVEHAITWRLVWLKKSYPGPSYPIPDY